KALNVVEKKRAIEKDFANWVSVEPERQKIYGSVLADIEAAYKESTEKLIQRRLWYFQETFMGAESLWFVWKLQTLPSVLKKKDSKPADFEVYRAMAKEQFKDYNMATDQKIFAALIEMYYTNIPQKYHPSIFAELNKKYKGDFTKMAQDIYSKSVVTSEEKFNNFLNKPSEKTWNKDVVVRTSQSIIETYFSMQQEMSAIDSKMQKAKRLFLDGMRKMYSNKVFYPNANSTMRLTYGQILDYLPADAVHYNFITTQKGILEKEDPNNDEFILPAKLKELLLSKDFGRYGKNGELPVCFIANTDITGGNSGSPMINAEGHLIGIAFDGNWEAMSGDVAFEPALQRTIGVDISYVLFIVDKYAGAKNLIKEMTIVE
ncbi:MAG: S46 family peptidase, partial [Bacteroidales bacterium]|nr:S46 family peptidase [Bacteroidales bacterium]